MPPNMTSTDNNGHPQRVRVIIRLLPKKSSESTDEDYSKDTLLIQSEANSTGSNSKKVLRLRSKDGESWQGYHFDAICGEGASQRDVFAEVRDALPGLLRGVSATIFAYGQTSTGKSHTMLGRGLEGVFAASSWSTSRLHVMDNREHWGVIPNAIQELFGKLQDSNADFSVFCSFMQIYNDRVCDLLAKSKSIKAGLNIREDASTANSGISVEGLSLHNVRTVDRALYLLYKGSRNRVVRATASNEQSSRSHAIFRLQIEVKSRESDGKTVTRRAKLHLVDLAGSEKWGTEERSQYSARELTRINSSLSALGNCVAALAKGNRHVPFRDSALTRLLKDSLGGGARAVIIATVSARPHAYKETASTLLFASRALSLSQILPPVRFDEEVDDAALLRRAHAELKQQLSNTSVHERKEPAEDLPHVVSKPNDGGPPVYEWQGKLRKLNKHASNTIEELLLAVQSGHVSQRQVEQELESFFTLEKEWKQKLEDSGKSRRRTVDVSGSLDCSTPMQGGENTCEQGTEVNLLLDKEIVTKKEKAVDEMQGTVQKEGADEGEAKSLIINNSAPADEGNQSLELLPESSLDHGGEQDGAGVMSPTPVMLFGGDGHSDDLSSDQKLPALLSNQPSPIPHDTSCILAIDNLTLQQSPCQRHGLEDCLCPRVLGQHIAAKNPGSTSVLHLSNLNDKESEAPLAQTNNDSPGTCERHGLESCFLCELRRQREQGASAARTPMKQADERGDDSVPTNKYSPKELPRSLAKDSLGGSSAIANGSVDHSEAIISKTENIRKPYKKNARKSTTRTMATAVSRRGARNTLAASSTRQGNIRIRSANGRADKAKKETARLPERRQNFDSQDAKARARLAIAEASRVLSILSDS